MDILDESSRTNVTRDPNKGLTIGLTPGTDSERIIGYLKVETDRRVQLKHAKGSPGGRIKTLSFQGRFDLNPI
jgi:hypothetical protein